jgi:hypothetical protein
MVYKRIVTRIINGDTFYIERKIDGSNVVRLAGIDTPNAKDELKKPVLHKTITIIPIGKSQGRVIANVSIGKNNVNSNMKKFEVEIYKRKVSSDAKNHLDFVLEKNKELIIKCKWVYFLSNILFNLLSSFATQTPTLATIKLSDKFSNISSLYFLLSFSILVSY